ncbi:MULTISPECIES: site-2 protease family protein [Thalassospira]|uniref:Site-2 protease family protein n=1 Tax=Thalassospira lohafexi TaxID=744227 RepID=A0A2N3L997_9PROT|nr:MULTISPECIES: site-2 protease family protein [Thalassospira]PKR59374.1 site-2 protease family protein [Thalassospira lohafexi]RCK21673.1 peptidase M48 [Thalassospira lucentensis MCCC 1A00383 = DSM 14000]
MSNAIEFIISASTWVVPVLFAVTLHEAAHGFAAKLFGDDTAQRLGRLSLNPIRHIDPVGTILIPALLLITAAPFLFGYAKPVPVAFHRLHPQRLGVIGVAVAGPLTNVLLAIVSILLLVGLPSFSPAVNDWLGTMLNQSIWLNCILAVFNMLPIPPLDGGRVLTAISPLPVARVLARMEKTGMIILIGLVFLLPYVTSKLGIYLPIFQWLVIEPANALVHFLAAIFA